MLKPRDVVDLEWYFTTLPVFSEGLVVASVGHIESSLGAQLERAAVYHTDSDGDVIPSIGGGADVLHEGEDGRLTMRHSPWPYMYVKKEAPQASGSAVHLTGAPLHPETDPNVVESFDRRSRLRFRLQQMPRELFRAMEALYGERGFSWANHSKGRVWVLIPLTTIGEREWKASSTPVDPWLHDLAKRSGLTWLDGAINQAERMQRQAVQAWQKTKARRDDDD